MKIVVFGLTISSSWGNGHATLWRGLCRALAARGDRVVFYERDVPYYAGARDWTAIPGGELVLYEDWPDIRRRAAADCDSADLALVSSFCPDGIEASRIVNASQAAVKAFYDLDTPVTLARLAAGEPIAYVAPEGLRDFDLVLSFTGGRALAELRDRLGARMVLPLYGHVDPESHHPAAPRDRFSADLSYLGTYSDDRQAALEEFLIAPARLRPERRFVIGGAQYPQDFPWTPNIHFVRHLEPGQHPPFFASSRLTLSVTRRAMRAMGWCPSGRLFEAAACGTPVLSDRWEGIESFYEPGQEILLADTTADAVAALDLGDQALRAIAAAARERTLAEHSSARRLAELDAALALALDSRARMPEEA